MVIKMVWKQFVVIRVHELKYIIWKSV